jgi:hypothetical protein
MDEARREQLERKHRPDLFMDCVSCGEASVKLTHVCDPVRKLTYQASLEPQREPNPERIEEISAALLRVLTRHRIVVTSGQLRDLALAVEPLTAGPLA